MTSDERLILESTEVLLSQVREQARNFSSYVFSFDGTS